MNDNYIATGHYQNIEVRKTEGLPEYNPKTRQHVWTLIASYKWKPGDTTVLHRGNLLSIDGPGCLHCGNEWNETIAKKPCKGDIDMRD